MKTGVVRLCACTPKYREGMFRWLSQKKAFVIPERLPRQAFIGSEGIPLGESMLQSDSDSRLSRLAGSRILV